MVEKRQVTTLQIIGYGTGHIFNDICASMWFTYFLLFFQEVRTVFLLLNLFVIIRNAQDSVLARKAGYRTTPNIFQVVK
jgi:hypothetical protein